MKLDNFFHNFVDKRGPFVYNTTCACKKCGALVKRSRRRPLTAESRVRFPDALPRHKERLIAVLFLFVIIFM